MMSRKFVKICKLLPSLTNVYKRLETRGFNNCKNVLYHKAINNQAGKQLYKNIYSRIKATGPISVADYMKEVLTHPTEGYYMSKDVFGPEGDFITSPEISQLFSEMVAVWIMHEWYKISDQKIQLVELGPGRGTLAQNILKILNHFKLADRVSFHLVEISPKLAKIQAEKLCIKYSEQTPETNVEQKHAVTHYKKGTTSTGTEVFWYYSIKDIPHGFSVFLAHEFFDALPIHKFQKTKDGWCEVMVDIDSTQPEREIFRYVLVKGATPASQFFIDVKDTRNHLEISPQSMVIIDHIANILNEYGGFSLIIDYGHDGDSKDSFRAFRKHRQYDPLLHPGSADLTADVDFSTFRKVATRDNRVICFGPVEQRDFLRRMGIDVRLEMLMKNASDNQKKILQRGYNMIMDENKMGSCFQILSMFPAVLKEHLEKFPVHGFFEMQNKSST